MKHPPGPPIIVALDNLNKQSALDLAQKLNPTLCRLKVGKELFTAYGPEFVESLMKLDFDVFLDLKFHDIPNTVANACYVAATLGVWMVDVHILGGIKMLQAAREAIDKTSGRKPLLIGISVLTSLNDKDLIELGFNQTIPDLVLRLAKIAHEAKFDGIVCSPLEVKLIRKMLSDDFCLVTPGVRLSGSVEDDQKRYLSPKEAITQGSDYLVIGRPITLAPDPCVALDQIYASLK